jgi:hypothetical protein
MATIKCTHCKSDVSTAAGKCPHCYGKLDPLGTAFMTVFAAGFLAFLGAAVGKGAGAGYWVGGLVATLYAINLVMNKRYIVGPFVFFVIALFAFNLK